MNQRMRNIFYLLFLGFICFHFLIPAGSHLHFCWEILEAMLCILDEQERRIENFASHPFHQEHLGSEREKSISKNPVRTEKHIHLTFLSSGDNLNEEHNTLQEDFIPQYFFLGYNPIFTQFIPLIAVFSAAKSFIRYLTSYSPSTLSII